MEYVINIKKKEEKRNKIKKYIVNYIKDKFILELYIFIEKIGRTVIKIEKKEYFNEILIKLRIYATLWYWLMG